MVVTVFVWIKLLILNYLCEFNLLLWVIKLYGMRPRAVLGVDAKDVVHTVSVFEIPAVDFRYCHEGAACCSG